MEDLLSRVNVVVSPAAAQFVPVTLPYGYKQVEDVEPVDTSSLALIVGDTQSFLAGLTAKHESRIEAIEQWKKERTAQDIAEKRRIAPGYFDGPNKLLVPTSRPAEPGQLETPKSEKPLEDDLSRLEL